MKKKETTGQKKFRIWRVFASRGLIAKISFFIIVFFVAMAIIAPLFCQNPLEQDLLMRYKMPSKEHLLGTDSLGRDIMSRIVYGTRISLLASLASGVFAAMIGITLGLIAGYYERFVGSVIMRIVDAHLSIPPLIFSMIVCAILGNGIWQTVVAIGIGMIPTYIRLVQGMVLTLKGNDYIVATSLLGQRNSAILFRHLLPNCFPMIIVQFTMNLGSAILSEAGLSFIGLGIVSPDISWGSMVAEGYSALVKVPLLAIMPGLCIALVVIALNFIGDGLRDALDPRLRGKL
ncbi:MAG: ABC transporter permease [Clostridia bacterium]|nr:ABC transporter permease [Clostridia bacterium]MBR3179100.1 ABC transporter permease [Clostridia bacterium]